MCTHAWCSAIYWHSNLDDCTPSVSNEYSCKKNLNKNHFFIYSNLFENKKIHKTGDNRFYVSHHSWSIHSTFSNRVKELLLHKSGLFTPTSTESAYSGHCLTTTGIAWLPTQLSASWTNITWTQMHCNHFPSGIHCLQLVLRHFTLVENFETIFSHLLFFFFFLQLPSKKDKGLNFLVLKVLSKSKHWRVSKYWKTLKCKRV